MRHVLYWFVIVALVAISGLAMASAFELPTSWRIYSVRSGSMEPAISTGSLVFVRARASYGVNDVVTYKKDPAATKKTQDMTVTHRIIETQDVDGSQVFITKGDANEAPDIAPVPVDSVIGKVAFSVPYVGYPVSYARTQTGFIILIVIPATLIIYSELLTIKREVSAKVAARKAKSSSAEIEEEAV